MPFTVYVMYLKSQRLIDLDDQRAQVRFTSVTNLSQSMI